MLAAAAVIAALIVWQPTLETFNFSDVGASKPEVEKPTAGCQTRPQPIHGIFARYGVLDPIAPFTIRTRSGSNYYVKLENAATGRPIATYYVYGGVPLNT
jgi:hypothetical protein